MNRGPGSAVSAAANLKCVLEAQLCRLPLTAGGVTGSHGIVALGRPSHWGVDCQATGHLSVVSSCLQVTLGQECPGQETNTVHSSHVAGGISEQCYAPGKMFTRSRKEATPEQV
jgi:hypothetical protein